MPTNAESEILDSTKVTLISPDKWYQLTRLRISRGRSEKLKKLDRELTKSYASLMRNTWTRAEAEELQKAMLDWQKSKGDEKKDWTTRPRNHNRTFEILDAYINHALTYRESELNAEDIRIPELNALHILNNAALHFRQVAQPMQEVRLKSDAQKAHDESARKYLQTSYEKAKERCNVFKEKIDAADKKSAQLAEQLASVEQLARDSGLAPAQISALLGSASSGITNARSSMLNPSNIYDKGAWVVDEFTNLFGKKALNSFEQAFNVWYQSEVVSSARKYVAAGTPDEAAKSLENLLHRSKRDHLKKGAIQSISGIVTSVGLVELVAVEIATAVGTLGIGLPLMAVEMAVAAAIKEAITQGEEAAIDYFVSRSQLTLAEKEVEIGNQILRSQNFDRSMFEKAPIFGAYFLRPGSGLSNPAILGLGSALYGTELFQPYVERLTGQVSTLRETSRIVINESPIEIVGVNDLNFIDKETLRTGSMDDERLKKEYDQINAEIRLKINEKLMWIEKREIKELALAAAPASSPQTFKPALQVWKQTLITRPNLEIIAAKSGVTQASHYQKKSNLIEQTGLNKDLPYGSLLTTEDWKEFSSVGFFSKQKPRFLFSRRTKETKVLDDAFATFQQDYSNQMIETARVVTNKSAASGEDLPIARHKMDQRWKQLDTLLKQIDVWLKAKQKSGTSTRMASVVHLYHLVLIEQQTVASERDRLGDPSQNIGTRAAPFHAQNPLHQLNPAREFKPRSWDQVGAEIDGRGVWRRGRT